MVRTKWDPTYVKLVEVTDTRIVVDLEALQRTGGQPYFAFSRVFSTRIHPGHVYRLTVEEVPQ